MEGSFDWLQIAIDHPMVAEPGSVFNYNSGATVILAHIFRKATGVDIQEYAHRHLFTPLGIERFYWKRTAMGLIDAEGGTRLACAGSGVGGQRPLIFPEHDLIVVYTGWNVQRPGMPLRVGMDRVLQALR